MKKKLSEVLSRHKTDCMLILIILFLMVHALYCFSFSDSRAAFLFSVITILMTAFVYLTMRILESKGRLRVETAFLIGVLVCGVLYSAVFAPGTVPDETYHFEASYKLADYLMLQGPTNDSLPMRGDDSAMLQGMLDSWTLGYQKYQMVADQFTLFVQQPSFGSVVPASTFDWSANPPYIKLPSALGIMISMLFHFGSYPLFYIGRFFNLLTFALLAYFAVRITPVGKNAMMVAGLLPMTLHVASSYSYDAGIIGLAFLLTAMCLRAVYGKGLMSRRHKIELVVVAVLLAPCKVVYIVIVLLVLLVPRERFSSKAASVRFKTLAIGCSFLAIAVIRAAGILQMAGVTASASTAGVRGAEQGTFYSLPGLIGDPINAILLFLRTFDVQGPFYIETLVGGSLGWFQAELQAPLYITFALLLVVLLSGQRSRDDDTKVPAPHRALFGVLTLASCLGVVLSMALGWTFTGESVIQGVQGRYFLPLLPLAVLALRSSRTIIDLPLGVWLVYAMVALNSAYLARTFAIAVGV